jgi:hypothetical protein
MIALAGAILVGIILTSMALFEIRSTRHKKDRSHNP